MEQDRQQEREAIGAGEDENEPRAPRRPRVFAALHGNMDLSQHGFPAHGDLDWYQPVTGWIVISLTQWAFGTNPPPFDGYAWLKAFDPVATIGKTVRLYYVDPSQGAATVPSTDLARSRQSLRWPQALTVGHICEG